MKSTTEGQPVDAREAPLNRSPAISVIIPSYNSRQTIGRCLDSVIRQEIDEPYEVIVIDSSTDGTDDIVCQNFPTVHLISFETRVGAAEARQEGIKLATAPIMAFTDSDCVVQPDWLNSLLKRHREGDYAGVGGSVMNGTPRSAVGSAEYLFEFNEYHPLAPLRFVTNIPTCNIAYTRSALLNHRFEGGPSGRFYQAEDMVLNWELVRRGAKILFDPQIRVVHLNRTALRSAMRHHYLLGRSSCWARKRTDLPGQIFARTPALAPTMPILRLARIAWRLFSFSKVDAARFALLLPLLLLLAGAWASGFAREATAR